MIVVEHDEDAICTADHLINIGPGAVVHGGKVVTEGTVEDIMATAESVTGQFLSGRLKIIIPSHRISADHKKVLKLICTEGNNFKNITLILPMGLLICVTEVSSSGKSTPINDTLYPIAQGELNGATETQPARYCKIEG